MVFALSSCLGVITALWMPAVLAKTIVPGPGPCVSGGSERKERRTGEWVQGVLYPVDVLLVLPATVVVLKRSKSIAFLRGQVNKVAQ